ncbi:MAG: FecR domain-containing protein [Acidobacteria bacterium]|nr:FecR domain-containing protein [Acidobacteriota bacterium]
MIPMCLPLILGLIQAPAPEMLVYRFDEVKRTVYRWPGGDQGKETKAARGDAARSGDMVRTGWLGQTVISVPDRNARFEVFADTQVQLSSGEPGVLVVLSHGRLKAIFQALVGGTTVERRVAVPGALLAVRGTKYGVEVDKKGKSTLAVFEGVVEVLCTSPGMQPIKVKAGEWSTFGPEVQPKAESMHARGFGEQSWGQGMRPNGTMAPGGMSPGGTMPKGMPSGGGSGHMHH